MSAPRQPSRIEDVENGTFDMLLTLSPPPPSPSSSLRMPPSAVTSRTVSVVDMDSQKYPQSTSETLVNEKPFNPLSAEALVPLPKVTKAEAPTKKRRVNKCIQFKLWFNTYRKFFTFIIILNAIGLGMTLSGHFTYALDYPGAFVLGNLLIAILMRNEVFGRFLYLIVNTLFAKVNRFAH